MAKIVADQTKIKFQVGKRYKLSENEVHLRADGTLHLSSVLSFVVERIADNGIVAIKYDSGIYDAIPTTIGSESYIEIPHEY